MTDGSATHVPHRIARQNGAHGVTDLHGWPLCTARFRREEITALCHIQPRHLNQATGKSALTTIISKAKG